MKAIKKVSDLRDLTLKQLESIINTYGEPSFRAKQIREWMWSHGVHNIADMLNLSKDLRSKLSKDYAIYSIEENKKQNSTDGTVKWRFKLWDGELIETVLIPVEKFDRFTVCVSSQVGCSLACTFCATGKMKRMRNLDPGEIYDQVKIVNDYCLKFYGRIVTNIVYMGMGEPLLTYAHVNRSIDLLTKEWGLHFSPKRITISTAGIARMIKKLADDHSKVNLAVSLHAPTDEKRNKIMAINATNNISVLMNALEYYYKQTKNRISYEYIALNGFNDSVEDANALADLCRRFPVRVNVIEYNSVPGIRFRKTPEDQLDLFAGRLRDLNVTVTVRRSRGKDIDAACGQLANQD